MTRHSFTDALIERSTQGAVTPWRRQPRDRNFAHNGQSILVDTFVLPTIRWSKNSGRGWAEGTGLFYLANLLGVAIDRQALTDLGQAWERFTSTGNPADPSPLTCPRCAKPTQAFGLCAECQKSEVAK